MDGIQVAVRWHWWMKIKDVAQRRGNMALENHLKGKGEEGKAHEKDGSRSDNKRKM